MKIIEALKTLKANKKKVEDLVNKIRNHSAIRSDQTSPYGNLGQATQQVSAWLDSIRQTLRENEILTRRIHITNTSTMVSIDLPGGVVTKTIDEWLVRRNSGVALSSAAFSALTDRGLREEFVRQPDGTSIPITIVRHYDAAQRDAALANLAEETFVIDSTLEIINATTDLWE